MSSTTCTPPLFTSNTILISFALYLCIIFQFPLYWFTCRPKTKEWFDKVLTAGWAFAGASHLEGKKIGIAVTCGSEETDYTAQGVHHLSVEEYLVSMRKSFEMCKANYIGYFDKTV